GPQVPMSREDGRLPMPRAANEGPVTSWRYRAITRNNVTQTRQWKHLPTHPPEPIQVDSAVLPFRTDDDAMSALSDWDRVPADPGGRGIAHATGGERGPRDVPALSRHHPPQRHQDAAVEAPPKTPPGGHRGRLVPVAVSHQRVRDVGADRLGPGPRRSDLPA